MPRVRTGCMTCRKRRRKCDEEKPECQNCRTKDLACRYGVNYTFVQYSQQAGQKRRRQDPPETPVDNAACLQYQPTRTDRQPTVAILSDDDDPEQFDPPHSVLQTPEAQVTGEFLEVTQRTEHESLDLGSTQFGHTGVQQTGSPQPEAQLCVAPLAEAPSDVLLPNPDEEQAQMLHCPSTSSFSCSAGRSSRPRREQASPQANDCALEIWPVLDGSRSLPNPFVKSRRILPPYANADQGISHVNINSDHPRTRTPPTNPIPALLPDDESLEFELLSHFRYAVAPQLDLDSEFSCWTVQAMRQAVSDTKLRCAIFALSSRSLAYARNWDFDFHEGRSRIFAARASCDLSDETGGTGGTGETGETGERLAVQVLLDWKCLLDTAPSQWLESSRQTGLSGLYEQSHSALYLLRARIHLASVIVAPVACVLHSDLLFDAAELSSSSDHAATIQLQNVMSLLHRSFSQNHNRLRDSQQLPPTLSWQTLWNEAQTWFSGRLGELRPIFEHQDLRDMACVESDIGDFPTVVFSNLHAVLANTSFHLAAIILLQCKPRLTKVCAKPMLMLSPTWHIVRILGIASIAISDDFYDPLLVSAIIKASKMLSNNEQLVSATKILHRVQTATGIKLHDELRALEKLQGEATDSHPSEGC